MMVASLIGPLSVAHAEDHRGGDRRGWRDFHDDHRRFDHDRFDYHDRFYRPPPVVYGYGAPYYPPPPVVYAPGFGINLPGVSVNLP